MVRSRSQKRLVLGRLARKRQLLHSLEPSGAQGKKASARCRLRERPISARGGEDTRLCSWPWGNCMGETLLLLSCGAAFITGLVIVAVSLFS